MKLYTPSVTISTLLALAFPLSVLLLGDERTRKNIFLKMAWLLTLVSYFQYAFLAEEQKFEQGAFGFGYDISLFILFTVTLCEHLSWYGNGRAGIGAPKRYAAAFLFSLHVASGIYYFGKLLTGGSYF